MSFGGGSSQQHFMLGTSRQQNLAAILGLLHHEGPQPRSRITATTGRNRSTVAALVYELVDRGLAVESQSDPTNQVGRPSATVTADPRNLAIAINPEVDAVTIGVIGLGGRVLERNRHESDRIRTASEIVAMASAEIRRLRLSHEPHGVIHGIGLAVPGLVRGADGLVRWAPHLEWYDEPIGRSLAEATGLPVFVRNDASLGAVAERIFGAGRGMTDLVYLNGGASGIGGGVIASGMLLEGATGYAGEFGHIRVDGSAGLADDREAGSLESRVQRMDLITALGVGSVDADVLDAAVSTSVDPEVTALVHRQLEFLSTSLRNIVNVFNPQMIVLGGFLGSIFSADPEYLRRRVAEQSIELSFEGVSIRRASLGADILLIGAGELVFAAMLDALRAGRPLLGVPPAPSKPGS